MQRNVRSLPFEEWPACDRDGWRAACIPSQRLRPGGTASHLQVVTQDSYARIYGYLLDFCSRYGSLDPAAAAAGHVTPDRIDAFLTELYTRVGSVTWAFYIQRIRRMAELVSPTRDFGWLREIEQDLKYRARPRAKQLKIIPSNRLLALGLDLIRRGEASDSLTDLARARLVRDGLMIALLALCPIRLKNFAALRLGQEMTRIGETWWIILNVSQTKSGRPDERPIPAQLTAPIERWLARWRPVFPDPGDAIWPSTKGGALAYDTVGMTIAEVTLKETGIRISPHLFRHCAVHTVATQAGAEMGVATAVLHQTDGRTAEEHYNKGTSLLATRKYSSILREFAGGD